MNQTKIEKYMEAAQKILHNLSDHLHYYVIKKLTKSFLDLNVEMLCLLHLN